MIGLMCCVGSVMCNGMMCLVVRFWWVVICWSCLWLMCLCVVWICNM